jgi:hypothetical protein
LLVISVSPALCAGLALRSIADQHKMTNVQHFMSARSTQVVNDR